MAQNQGFWDFNNSKKICDHNAAPEETKGSAEIAQRLFALGGREFCAHQGDLGESGDLGEAGTPVRPGGPGGLSENSEKSGFLGCPKNGIFRISKIHEKSATIRQFPKKQTGRPKLRGIFSPWGGGNFARQKSRNSNFGPTQLDLRKPYDFATFFIDHLPIL